MAMMDEVVGFVTWAVILRQERISWSTWWLVLVVAILLMHRTMFVLLFRRTLWRCLIDAASCFVKRCILGEILEI